MDIAWILFALIASLGNSARDLYIKKYIDEPSQLVVASTRLMAFFILLVFLPFLHNELAIDNSNWALFIFLLLITVILTFVATSMKIRIIQKEEISISSPLLSLTPIFIIPWSMVLLGETINTFALIGVVFSMFGAFLVLDNKNALKNMNFSKYSSDLIIILAILGLTTVIDKIEIGFAGAYMYSLIWTGSSAVAGLYAIQSYGLQRYVKNTLSIRNLIQSALWAVSFFAQQTAVQMSYGISMNTAYIKSVMYFGIIFNVLVGGKLFVEKKIIKKLIGTIIIIIGSLIILFSL